MVSIRIEGAKKLANLFARAPEIARKEVRSGLIEGEAVVHNKSVLEAPADTGTLRKKIATDFDFGNFIARTTPKVKYAEAVHEGHGVIVPRRKKVLAVRASRASVKTRAKFGKGRTGWIIFGKRVRATKPNRFMTRAAKKAFPEVKKIFEKAQGRIIKKLTI